MFTEDFSAFFDTSTGFAQVASLGGVAVAGIFDNASAMGNVGAMGMGSSGPTLTLPTAQVPADPVGTAAVVNGTSYLVAAHEPDGTGISVLILEAAT